MTSQPKASKGSVGIESSQGRLRLRLPRQLYGGKQKYLTLGLADNPENRKSAEQKARQIELDILAGYFDETLNKYKPQTHLTTAQTSGTKQEMENLGDLWQKYTLYKSKHLQATTILTTYRRIKNHISSLPTQDLKDAVTIRDHLLAGKSRDTAKRVLTHLSACCAWACDTGLIDMNPFQGMAGKIKKVKSSHDYDIDPFTVEERNAIIAAFDEHKHYRYYANFVRFLFMTGCRTGEAVALKWKHIDRDCLKITFCESVNTQLKIRKDTKTHKVRRFPCNSSLQALLRSIRPEHCDLESLVFPSLTGQEIDASDFLNHAWRGYKNRHGNQVKGIVTQLVEEGKVKRYRPQYNTRHTFITHCLEEGINVVQISKWVGNSPEIIMQHYAGIIEKVEVPEF